jgi:hypothetical protein
LIDAAEKALAGSDSDVLDFLHVGQFEVLEQSLESSSPFSKGWFVRGEKGENASLGSGDPVPSPKNGKDATWKIVPGLGNKNCYSLNRLLMLIIIFGIRISE